MSSRLLPRLVSVRKSVLKESNFQGEVPSDALLSLCSVVERCSGIVAEVAFSTSDEGRLQLAVDVVADVEQVCQRCLEVVQYQVKPHSVLTVVKHDEEAKQRLRDVEPLVLEDDEIDLYHIIEQELSLALPAVAAHTGEEFSRCEDTVAKRLKTNASFVSAEAPVRGSSVIDSKTGNVKTDLQNAVSQETHRPFEGLADILNLDSSSSDRK